MRNTAIVMAALMVALGGLMFLGIVPLWLSDLAETGPGGAQGAGLAVAALGLFQLGRRRPRVRYVTD